MKLLFIILFIIPSLIYAQEKVSTDINWLTIEEAVELSKKQPRKILIDFYTKWCGPCKLMSSNTFKEPNIVNYINNNFYAVKFNAEGPDSTVFNGKTYYNKAYDKNKTGRNSTHDLTKVLAPSNGRIAYPTVVYLDEQLKIMSAVPGYMKPRQMQPILIYFAENLNKVTPYEYFSKTFEQIFFDTTKVITDKKIEWLTIEEAESKCKEQPRKILIHLDSDWSLTSKMMIGATYEDSVIAQYVNENFYPVLLNATFKDSIVFNQKVYKNENNGHPFHQLPVDLMDGRLTFPATIFINSDFSTLSAVPGYQAHKNIEPILRFFAEDIYQSKKWEEFLKTFTSQIPD